MCDITAVRCLFAAVLVAAMLAGAATAGAILPTGLAPGSRYQLAFVTDGTTEATNGSESYYTNIAEIQAAPLTAVLPSGTTWSAVTSTYDGTNYTSALGNAPTYAGVPIYNTNGQLVAGGSPNSLWDGGALQNPIAYDQNGNLLTTAVWTGTSPYGWAIHQLSLGEGGSAAYGLSDPPVGYGYGWVDFRMEGNPSNETMAIYALSSPITIVPEPVSFTLLGAAALGLAGLAYLRRRWVRT